MPKNRKSCVTTIIITALCAAQLFAQDTVKPTLAETAAYNNSPAAIAATVRAQNSLSAELVRKVGLMRSDDATDVMLNWIAQDRGGNLAGQCIGYLQFRQINRALSAAEMSALQWRLRYLDGYAAGSTARLLGRCTHNDAGVRARSIIDSFQREVENPSPIRNTDSGYVSVPVSILNSFLLAISDINDLIAARIIAQELANARSEPMRQWLMIAAGFAGDETVAVRLKTIVERDANSSIRVVALAAYARSAGEKAVPFLETFLNDKTLTGGPGHLIPNYGLQSVARDTLAKLRAKK